MSAKHALLGLLLDRAGYPYQLADRLQRRLGPVWEVNSGQLYQTLDERQLRAARAYAERFPEEIEPLLQENHRPLEQLRELYPSLHGTPHSR